MNMPVRPFPALQCTTTALRASAARYAAASQQKLCRRARGGACQEHGAEHRTHSPLLVLHLSRAAYARHSGQTHTWWSSHGSSTTWPPRRAAG